MNEALSTVAFHHDPPWHLQGDAFILNYWLTPNFIKHNHAFHIAPSPIGRVVQVILVRYHESPVGPYDELLLLDHPLISKRRLSSIAKIYVSTETSVVHGQHFWGIPKQLAEFEWVIKDDVAYCTISFEQQEMSLCLYKYKHNANLNFE